MDLFRDIQDFRIYRKLWVTAKKRFHLKVYRWTWMTNHIHVLLQQLDKTGVAEAMHFVQGRFARYFGRKYGWKGHVWEARYTNRLILDETYFIRCAGYIENNPVEAGIVEQPFDYPWSSAPFYALGYRDPLTDRDPYFKTAYEDLAISTDLFIGRRAVGRHDQLQQLSSAIGKTLLIRSNRSSYPD